MRIRAMLSYVASIVLAYSPILAEPPCKFPAYGWTRTAGPQMEARGVAVDRDGNVVYVGHYESRQGELRDFDPTEGEDWQVGDIGYNAFITKLGPDGSYHWTRTLAGRLDDWAQGVALDPEGNIYVTGYFGTFPNEGYALDFDPTEGVDIHTTVGGNDIFLTRIDADGSYGWTHTFGGTNEYGPVTTDRGDATAVDPSGFVYLAGHFDGTVDFDPGPGEDLRSSGTGPNAFLSRFTWNGDYQWTIDIGDDVSARAYAVAVGSDGDVILAGDFGNMGKVDFDPGPQRYRLDAGRGHDGFVARYGPQREFRWATAFGGPTTQDQVTCWDVAVDSDGYVYLGGSFNGTVDFDPGRGEFIRTDPRYNGAFLSGFTPSGQWRWSWVPENREETEEVRGIDCSVDEAVFLTGEFELTVDFNPTPVGPGDPKHSNGGSDFFVTALRRDGEYLWTGTGGAAWGDGATDLTVDPDGRISFGGSFFFTVDFDPTEGVDYHTAPGEFPAPAYFVSNWLCGACPAIYAHRADGGAGFVSAYLHTAAADGRALIRCRGEGGEGTFQGPVLLDKEGKGEALIGPMPPGDYTCSIQKLRDAHGDPQCPRRASPRKVTVK